MNTSFTSGYSNAQTAVRVDEVADEAPTIMLAGTSAPPKLAPPPVVSLLVAPPVARDSSPKPLVNAAEALAEVSRTPAMVKLPGPNHLISSLSAELVKVLRPKDLYLQNQRVVLFLPRDGKLMVMVPEVFRTWIELFVTCFKETKDDVYDTSMSQDTASAVLSSPQFREGLRKLVRVNTCRMPVYRKDDVIELLPEDYDEETQALTVSRGCDFDERMPFDEAVKVINGLLAEFEFTDGQRSKAVAVAAMVGLFAALLLADGSLRPCFVVLANGEGAGKSLLVKALVIAIFGVAEMGARPEREEEFEKRITALVLEGGQILILDNLKGHLDSPSLENFISSANWKGRLLGSSTTVTGPNLATVFITGNGLTISPDIRRRALLIELRLSVERAEDRVFQHPLNDKVLREMRPQVLAALWALVRRWDEAGRPKASRSHSAFPDWAALVGGIVEVAGFGDPFVAPAFKAAVDADGEDMRRLVEAMARKNGPCTFKELIDFAVEMGCFERILGITSALEDCIEVGAKLTPRQTSILGRLLQRYDLRQIGSHRFIIEGKGHARRYRVEPVGQATAERQGGITPA